MKERAPGDHTWCSDQLLSDKGLCVCVSVCVCVCGYTCGRPKERDRDENIDAVPSLKLLLP